MRYTTGDPIEMTILRKTPLGYLVQIDEETTGLLFQSDVFSPVRIGEAIDGYIKTFAKMEKSTFLNAHKGSEIQLMKTAIPSSMH